jgi:hypothetical protein
MNIPDILNELANLRNGLTNCIENARIRNDLYDVGYMTEMNKTIDAVLDSLAQSPDGRPIDKAMVKRLAVQHGLIPDDNVSRAELTPKSPFTGDAHECLLDVVSHYHDFRNALEFREATAAHAHDTSYWRKQLDVLDRMKDQAERATGERARDLPRAKKSPDDWIEWVEPLGDGSEAVYSRARASDVAAVRRRNEPRYVSDEQAIDDFVVVYWARRFSSTPAAVPTGYPSIEKIMEQMNDRAKSFVSPEAVAVVLNALSAARAD